MESGLRTLRSVRRCSAVCAVATRIATGFGQNGPLSATKMADSHSDSWRRGWDSNPGSLRSTVFKGAPERSWGSVSVRFEREGFRFGASPSASVPRRRCQRSCHFPAARRSAWRCCWSRADSLGYWSAIPRVMQRLPRGLKGLCFVSVQTSRSGAFQGASLTRSGARAGHYARSTDGARRSRRADIGRPIETANTEPLPRLSRSDNRGCATRDTGGSRAPERVTPLSASLLWRVAGSVPYTYAVIVS